MRPLLVFAIIFLLDPCLSSAGGPSQKSGNGKGERKERVRDCTWWHGALPPTGPVVDSVPIVTNPAILAQDRLVVSTTQLRALNVDVLRRARLVDARERDAATPLADDDRIANLENQVRDLTESMELLRQVVEGQTQALGKICEQLKEQP